MSETPLTRDVILAIGSDPFMRAFRNNVGVLQDKHGNYVAYGLAVGSSDVIGWRSRIITPEMVGQRVAVFFGIETKVKGKRTQRKRLQTQNAFLDTILRHGGYAGIAHSVDEAREILCL